MKRKFNPFVIAITLAIIGIISVISKNVKSLIKDKDYEKKYVIESDEEIEIKDEGTYIEEYVIEDNMSTELLDSGYNFKNIDFENLKNDNEDVVGWLCIDGCINDQPIVMSEDNQDYLKTNFFGEYSTSGTVFEDYRDTPLNVPVDELSQMTTIYGHHMKNGAMLAHVCNYQDKKYIINHPDGKIYTDDDYVYQVKFFAGCIIDGNDDELLSIENCTGEDFKEYIDFIKSRSTFESKIVPDDDDKLLSIVTCTYQWRNARYVLFGVLEKNYTSYDQIEVSVKKLERK